MNQVHTIKWSEDFSVDVKLLDYQHRKLVGILNKMIRDPGATTQSVTVSEVLDEMTHYAALHFKSEEDLLVEYQYPKIEAHKKQHTEFIKKTLELCMAATEKIEVVPQDLLQYLQEWLTNHILNEDMAYKSFLKDNGVC